jgi:hypothetical protein
VGCLNTNSLGLIYSGSCGSGTSQWTDITGGINYSGGKVGIGSSTPWALLSVNPNALGTSPAFVIGSTTGTSFVVTNSGLVGIGTSSPQYKLVVQGDSASDNYTALFHDATPTTGTTRVVIRMGDGWLDNYPYYALELQTPTGTTQAGIDAFGTYQGEGVANTDINSSGMNIWGHIGFQGTGDKVKLRSALPGSYANLTGTSQLVNLIDDFAPDTGDGLFNALSFSGLSISQNAGTGITRGINLTPTINGAYDYRQLEIGSTVYIPNFTTPPTTLYSSLFNPYILSSSTAITFGNVANLTINGAPVASSSNVTISSSTALYIPTQSVSTLSGIVTRAYGLAVGAPTGALNNYAAVFTGGSVGIGTTTPFRNTLLSLASSTNPQLSLVDSANIAQWVLRNAGGMLYFATTTVAGTSTTTLAAFTINGLTGGLSLGTTTAGTLKITSAGLVWADTNSSSGGYATIAEEGSALTQRTTLNFIGTGITCLDNSGSSRTDCTVSAGGAAGSWSTTTSSVAGRLINYSNNNTDIITIGANATTTAKMWFDPNIDQSYFNGSVGFGTSSPWAAISASTTSSNPLAVFDQRGTGGLLTLQSLGIDRLTVANSGGLSIFADTADIVRTKTGTTGANDFSRAGSTLTNVTSLNDQISIDSGTISGEGTLAATSTVTSALVGSGGQVILRTDGKYLIIHGNSSATASVWNGRTNGTISALGVNVVSTGAVGSGAIALKRADGRYQMIHGGSSAGLTSIFDPMGIAPTVAGAAACGAAAVATGTNAILRPDGNYLVMCGGLNATSMFNPVTGAWTVGPTLSTGTFGAGSVTLARDDGTFLVLPGNNTANTFVYSPYNTTTNIGTMVNVTISGAPTIGTSTVAIRRQDGKFLIITGTANASYLYDPVRTQANPEGRFTSLGVGPSATMGEGAQAIWRQDGKYLLLLGGTTATNVVDPGSSNALPTFTSSGAPTLSATPGFGMTAFMLPDGRYGVVLGGGTNAINTYDMNFIRGGDPNASTGGTGSEVATYETECIVNNNINPSSTLNWTANSEGSLYFQVKMGSGGSCSGSYQTVTRSGDLIGAASTTNAVQIKVFFKRDLPVFLDQEWGLRRSYLTRYRRVNKDPAIYDISIDNGNLLHRTQFDFGSILATTTSQEQGNLASGPVSINIANNNDRSLGMSLIQGIGLAAGFNTTMSGFFNGAFASSTALTTGTASSTLVLKRPDGKFVIITGTTTNSTMIYDQNDGTISLNSTSPDQSIGQGAQAFKRPDGKFFIIYGNGSNGTSIYDPVANTFSVGTSTVALVGVGSQIIPLPNGKVLIIHGNASQTTSIYDPVQNTMIAGPATTAVVGPGSMVIPNADGTYMVSPGSATTICTAAPVTATMQFDPYTMMFTAAGSDGLAAGTGVGS